MHDTINLKIKKYATCKKQNNCTTNRYDTLNINTSKYTAYKSTQRHTNARHDQYRDQDIDNRQQSSNTAIHDTEHANKKYTTCDTTQ